MATLQLPNTERVLSLLVVDDERSFREFLAELLALSGFEVRQAANGDDALAMLKSSAPDLLITDVIMEGTDGIDLIPMARKQHPNLPIIAMSGGGRIEAETYLEVGRHLGADLTLRKPFREAELLDAITRLLAQSDEFEAS